LDSTDLVTISFSSEYFCLSIRFFATEGTESSEFFKFFSRSSL
jgi:hypothetical protein